MSRHVYGPVPSRRLGRSLGVSPVPPKTCTYSCVYCQLGRTTHMTVQRQSFHPVEEVLDDIEEALEGSVGALDHVTLVGDGEPTLCSDVGRLIHSVKAMCDVPVAVLTNGSLLSDPEMRSDLMEADRVLPTLTTADPATWRRIHRPHGSLDLDTVISGLAKFRAEYDGDLWLEVMLVAGLNDDEASLAGLHRVIGEIGPDRLDVLVPTRPPSEPWVEAPEPGRVLRALEVLEAGSALTRESDGGFDVSGYSSPEEAISEIGSRHPLREVDARDICASLGEPSAVVTMLEKGELVKVNYRGETFLMPSRMRGVHSTHGNFVEET